MASSLKYSASGESALQPWRLVNCTPPLRGRGHLLPGMAWQAGAFDFVYCREREECWSPPRTEPRPIVGVSSGDSGRTVLRGSHRCTKTMESISSMKMIATRIREDARAVQSLQPVSARPCIPQSVLLYAHLVCLTLLS